MAGAPIPPATAQAFVDMGITPQNVYGMTENSSHHYTWPDDPQETICETCGRGGDAYRLKIFDPENPDIELPWRSRPHCRQRCLLNVGLL